MTSVPPVVPTSPEVLRETETWFRKRGLPYFVPEERAAARKALRLARRCCRCCWRSRWPPSCSAGC